MGKIAVLSDMEVHFSVSLLVLHEQSGQMHGLHTACMVDACLLCTALLEHHITMKPGDIQHERALLTGLILVMVMPPAVILNQQQAEVKVNAEGLSSRTAGRGFM